MSILEWLVVALASFIGVAWLVIVPRIWQNSWRGLPDEPPEAWPYGHALWRGFVRGATVGGAFALVGAAAVLSEGIEFGSPFESALDIAVHILAPLALIPGLTVILFNRPKLVVPPHMRAEPGAISEWISSHRSRGRSSTSS